MKLDKTKVYYLGDLSDEQLLEFAKAFEKEKKPSQAKGFDLEFFKLYMENRVFRYGFWDNTYLWGFFEEIELHNNITNALTLFTQPKNERIAQIQLRIQELNNELIDLDEEMRTLTYGK